MHGRSIVADQHIPPLAPAALMAAIRLLVRAHLANPNALNWGERRVKNDVVDATDLADMLRLGGVDHAA